MKVKKNYFFHIYIINPLINLLVNIVLYKYNLALRSLDNTNSVIHQKGIDLNKCFNGVVGKQCYTENVYTGH